MSDLNIIAITGRFTRDPELKKINEKSLANFSLAVSKGKEEVSYFDCTAWEKTAELIQKYCKKGKQVNITGELKQERWEKDGQKFNRVCIVVKTIQLLGSKPEQETQEYTPTQYKEKPASNPEKQKQGDSNEVEDDIF